MKKWTNFIILLIFILFLISLIIVLYNFNSKKYIYTKYFTFKLNKIIIVGDSRMSLIRDKKEKYKLPDNFIIDAKSGAKAEWLREEGFIKLNELLSNKDENYKYHVIFNMGVNDINDYDYNDIKLIYETYINLYKYIINYNKDVNFYFLSVNPVNEKTIINYFGNNRTNKKIKKLNKYFKKYITTKNNLYYCNSYDNIDFELYDGLHYTDETDIKIINYIENNCVIK